MSSDTDTFHAHLSSSKRILVIVSAGVSTTSGLGMLRGPNGDNLWRGRPITGLCTRGVFSSNPDRVWQYYSWFRHTALQAAPNAAHYALTALSKAHPSALTLNQNIDGLSARSGHPSDKIENLHGNRLIGFFEHRTRKYLREDGLDDEIDLEPEETDQSPALPRNRGYYSPHNFSQLRHEAIKRAMGVGQNPAQPLARFCLRRPPRFQPRSARIPRVRQLLHLTIRQQGLHNSFEATHCFLVDGEKCYAYWIMSTNNPPPQANGAQRAAQGSLKVPEVRHRNLNAGRQQMGNVPAAVWENGPPDHQHHGQHYGGQSTTYGEYLGVNLSGPQAGRGHGRGYRNTRGYISQAAIQNRNDPDFQQRGGHTSANNMTIPGSGTMQHQGNRGNRGNRGHGGNRGTRGNRGNQDYQAVLDALSDSSQGGMSVVSVPDPFDNPDIPWSPEFTSPQDNEWPPASPGVSPRELYTRQPTDHFTHDVGLSYGNPPLDDEDQESPGNTSPHALTMITINGVPRIHNDPHHPIFPPDDKWKFEVDSGSVALHLNHRGFVVNEAFMEHTGMTDEHARCQCVRSNYHMCCGACRERSTTLREAEKVDRRELLHGYTFSDKADEVAKEMIYLLVNNIPMTLQVLVLGYQRVCQGSKMESALLTIFIKDVASAHRFATHLAHACVMYNRHEEWIMKEVNTMGLTEASKLEHEAILSNRAERALLRGYGGGGVGLGISKNPGHASSLEGWELAVWVGNEGKGIYATGKYRGTPPPCAHDAKLKEST